MAITIEQINSHVTKLINEDASIYLIGTAHVSEESAQTVIDTINSVQPDEVCVELCAPRLDSLEHEKKWADTNLYQVIREGKAYVLLAQLILASLQKRLADSLNIRPGEEMRVAISTARARGISITPIDRSIKITLKRAWANTSLWSFAKIVCSLIDASFSRTELTAVQIEQLKEHDALTSALAELSKELPQIKESLIDERDRYMAEQLRRAKGKTVVAVVGAGHVPGILKHIQGSQNIEELNSIPRSKPVLKWIGYSIPVSIVLLLVYGFVQAGSNLALAMAWSWWITHGVLTGLAVLPLLPHPITLLCAVLGSPITALLPTVAAGWICGLSEAYLRKPTVEHLQTVADDASSLAGLWRNQVSRIFLIIILANIGSALGTAVGTGLIIRLLQTALN